MVLRARLSEGGFTLVEVILSLVVLGIALVPLINLFGQAAERHTLPDEVIAGGLAAAKMEEAIARKALLGFASFTASQTTYTDVDSSNFPNYQWKDEVVNVAESDFNLVSAGSKYKRVTVWVKKPDTEELKLFTVVTDY